MAVGLIGFGEPAWPSPSVARGLRSSSSTGEENPEGAAKAEKTPGKSDKQSESMKKNAASSERSAEEMKQIRELITRDSHVRSHEAAHMAAGGQYITGGVSYTYQTGPDGKRYAVGGEVGIDTSPERDPESTINKMQVVRRAALAPSDPSGADRSVAAAAAKQEVNARMELARQKTEELAAKLEAARKDRAEPAAGEKSETAESAGSRELTQADQTSPETKTTTKSEGAKPSAVNTTTSTIHPYAPKPVSSRLNFYA